VSFSVSAVYTCNYTYDLLWFLTQPRTPIIYEFKLDQHDSFSPCRPYPVPLDYEGNGTK